MRVRVFLLLFLAMPASAQTPHQRRLDVLVDAAREILVAQAARPIHPPQHGGFWCVAPDAPDQRVRVRTWAPQGRWLWCFPADVPTWWAGPWR